MLDRFYCAQGQLGPEGPNVLNYHLISSRASYMTAMVTPGSVQAKLHLYSAMILPREGQAILDPYDTNT